MTQAMFTSDNDAIEYLQNICQFQYTMKDNHCQSISFHDLDFVFEGTLRRHPLKHEILAIVANFKELESFNIRKCKISIIPEMVSESLTFVDISCNDLEQVPDWILRQKNLRQLNLGANKLQFIPDLDKLPLEVLKLHKNAISNMPKVSENLYYLNLYLNKFETIPAAVVELEKLESLAFGISTMKSLPSLNKLKSLKWLTLTVNEIEEIPDYLCEFSNLQGLQLAKNKIRELPQNIGNTNLQYLTLYCNCISCLPESFFQLNLKKLSLEYNELQDNDRQRVLDVFKNIDFLKV